MTVGELPGIFHGLLRLQMLRESIASVALSHDIGCTCVVCRAADGDQEAVLQILAEMGDEW